MAHWKAELDFPMQCSIQSHVHAYPSPLAHVA